ncbi:aldo/keto reductase [Tetragenococcus koreensis]|uniref:Aldo/keto reductase n=1 Tax=Tetragenococcus koreensis TaxID=290335 RepID=A0AAN4ZSC2_9ENTE|nr:aldo/keto reductase [Tetragenococcus koreensis]MDN6665058.1 aldo/keto reductase [Tetragenococcus koreensis]GEQ50137.1 aldo/keto reductase [Tetragenococcus koreensis]GEQ52612.1 aldo/keto reductase [Tetragenococcus koreensis]GEQ55147.1 aldo/keto reductase [Tetragenococcus koreensis]GEQ57613.1 aldo/keto reductase [Tetragenococcus koreensis]
MNRITINEETSYSNIALGFWRLLDWNLTDKELIYFLEQCLDLGITTMDHADIYGNYQVEESFGKALNDRPDLKNKMEIVTKCGIVYKSSTARVKYYNYSKEYIIQQVDRSLKNLGVDTINTLLLHRPSEMLNPEEVSEAFDELYQNGKVRNFGVSNFLPEQYRTLKQYVHVPLVTNQIELSPLNMENMENGVLDLALQEKIPPFIWSPLAGGKIFTGNDQAETRLRKTLEIIREEIGANDIGEVVFAWLLSHPANLIPITGSGEIDLVKTPINALEYKLTLEQWYMIWTAVKGHKVP